MTQSNQPMIVITGGGTGGHIFPALAVANALKARYPQAKLSYIGHPKRMEAHRAVKAGLPFSGVRFSGFPRSQLWLIPFWLVQWVTATLAVAAMFIRNRPTVVFATGGFVTAPVLSAALLLGIPFVVHEPDAMPGLVNRLFGRFATACTCAFQAAIARLGNPANAHVTGNPVRGDIGKLTKEAAQTKLFGAPLVGPCILVMGGSQGAASLNTCVLNSFKALHQQLNATVIHQTGEKHWPTVCHALRQFGETPPYYHPMAFIEDIPATLAAADVVVCRSGSITLSELALAKRPALLVPYPFAAANHQWKNAQALVNLGAAQAIDDAQLSEATLIHHLSQLLEPVTHAAMSEAMGRCAMPNATNAITGLLIQQLES